MMGAASLAALAAVFWLLLIPGVRKMAGRQGGASLGWGDLRLDVSESSLRVFGAIESLIALGLLVPPVDEYSIGGAGLLFAVFAVQNALWAAEGRSEGCGCGSILPAKPMTWASTCLLCLLSVGCLLLVSIQLPARPLWSLGGCSALLFTLGIAALSMSLNQVRQVREQMQALDEFYASRGRPEEAR